MYIGTYFPYILFVFKNKNQYNYRIIIFQFVTVNVFDLNAIDQIMSNFFMTIIPLSLYHGLKPRAFISKISLESNWRVFKTLMLLHIKHLIKIAKYYSLLLSSYLLWESCDDPSVPHIELYALPRSQKRKVFYDKKKERKWDGKKLIEFLL